MRPAIKRAFASGKPACVNVLTNPTVVYDRSTQAAERARREFLLKRPATVTSSRKEYRGYSYYVRRDGQGLLISGVLSQARAGGRLGSRQADLRARLQPPAIRKRHHAITPTPSPDLDSYPVLKSMAIRPLDGEAEMAAVGC